MSKRFIIGIDLGGTNLKLALVDLNYGIRDKTILNTRGFINKEQLIDGVVRCVKDFIGKNRLSRRDLLGIGLGLPGPIDSQKGLVHFFPNIPGWKEVKLKAILEKKLKLPVFIDNDANLMALAEFRLGAARNTINAVCITLGTGVGAGLIINSALFRGTTFAAGEAGHIPINENGPKCNCGGRACLETYIGNRRIEAEARRVFSRNISLEELSSLARKGNRKAEKIWSSAGRRLGVALTGIVNLLNPDCIVIGGGVANAGRFIFDTVKQTILKRAMPVQARHVKVLKAKLGNDSGLIGAAILAREGRRA